MKPRSFPMMDELPGSAPGRCARRVCSQPVATGSIWCEPCSRLQRDLHDVACAQYAERAVDHLSDADLRNVLVQRQSRGVRL